MESPWQTAILNSDDTYVNIIIDPEDELDKDALYARINEIGYVIPNSAKTGRKILRYVCNVIGDNIHPGLFVIHLPEPPRNRTACDYLWYSITKLKNGCAHYGIVNRHQVRFDRPKVWVFVTEPPTLRQYARDCILWHVVDDKLVLFE